MGGGRLVEEVAEGRGTVAVQEESRAGWQIERERMCVEFACLDG